MKNFMHKQKFLLLLLGWLMPFGLMAQEVTITGRVTDTADGSVLPGVTIVVQGTTSGTISTPAGDYTIKANVGDVLIYTFVGFNAEERTITAGVAEINVAMSSSVIGMEEVVVIGYGSVKKSDLTGSVVSIKSEDLNRGAVSSPQELLQGKVSGLFVQPGDGGPGSSSTIRIRSGASLNASNDPLIVIDGVPVSNDAAPGSSNALSTINPNDIETYTILKDASATAIYGSRASNGVIIITTKKGSQEGVRVSYSSTYSLKDPNKKIETLGAMEYRETITELWSDGTSSGNSALAILNAYPDQSTNWQDEIFKTGFATDQNISISGNYKTMPIRLSIGYYNENGTLKTSKLERYTGGLSLNPKFFEKHLSVDFNVKVSKMDSRFADSGAVGSAAFYDPTKPVMGEGANSFNGYYNVIGEGGDPNTLAPVNPMSLLYDVNNTGELIRSMGNVQFDYKVHGFEDLKANLNLAYDWTKSNGVNAPTIGSFQAAKDSDFRNIGQGSDWEKLRRNRLLDIYLNYNKRIESISSNIDAMAGYSWQHFYAWNYERTLSNVTVAGTKDGWFYDTEQSRYLKDGSRKIPYENYLVSFFGRVNFNMKDRYLLTGTIRRDGSSRFSEDNRWGIFPSAAFAWTLTNEEFMINQDVVSTLKLRVGYGVTGQQEVGENYDYRVEDYYGYIPSYIYGSNPNSVYLGQYLSTGSTSYLLKPGGYNPDLKWEETSTINFAIDYGFLNNRINGSIEFYKKETKDLLNKVDAPAGTNFTNIINANVGTMENKGIEFNVNVLAIVKQDVKWELGYNITWSESEITKLTANFNPDYPGLNAGNPGFGTGVYVQKHIVGYTPYTFYLFQQVYDNNGKPIQNTVVDRDGDGQITDGDRYLVKNAMPKFFMGFSSQLTYKNWDLGFNLRANIGNYMFNAFASNNATVRNFTNQGYLTNIYEGATNTGFTELSTTQQKLTDLFLENASFLKMDNLTLGYSFSNIMQRKIAGRISASVQNVFTITDYSGLDPEYSDPKNPGIDTKIWPRPQIFTIGLNLNF